MAAPASWALQWSRLEWTSWKLATLLLRPAPCHASWAFEASDTFLELEELPGRVVFMGGGYISFEFAHIAARAGAGVTILHRGQRPLEGFDPDLVNQLVGRTKRLGVNVEVRTEVEAIEKSGD